MTLFNSAVNATPVNGETEMKLSDIHTYCSRRESPKFQSFTYTEKCWHIQHPTSTCTLMSYIFHGEDGTTCHDWMKACDIVKLSDFHLEAQRDITAIQLCSDCQRELPTQRIKNTAQKCDSLESSIDDIDDKLTMLDDDDTLHLCTSCEEFKPEDDLIQVRECPHCESFFNGTDSGRNCEDCNRPFTRKVSDKGCPDCIEEEECEPVNVEEETSKLQDERKVLKDKLVIAEQERIAVVNEFKS